jgi:hypothetical protein
MAVCPTNANLQLRRFGTGAEQQEIAPLIRAKLSAFPSRFLIYSRTLGQPAGSHSCDYVC